MAHVGFHGSGALKPPQPVSILTTLPYSKSSRVESRQQNSSIWRFPKIRGTFLGVPIVRIIILWGLFWGSPI